MTIDQCATGSRLRETMQNAITERVRAENGQTIDLEVPFVERAKRFKQSLKVEEDAMIAFQNHKAVCSVCRR